LFSAMDWKPRSQVGLAVLAAAVLVHLARRRRLPRVQGDRVALLTGAAGGIGRETVVRLASLGWKVIATDRDEAALLKIYEHAPGSVTTVAADISTLEGCQALADEVHQRTCGRLHALVNCAGLLPIRPVVAGSDEEDSLVFAVNLRAPMRLAKLFWPMLVGDAAGGVVVNVSSKAARQAFLWTGCYGASKAALTSHTEALRAEAKANGLPLRAVIIEPGPVVTPMISDVSQRQLRWAEENPSSPWGKRLHQAAKTKLDLIAKGVSLDAASVTPGEVADAICHACSHPCPPAVYPVQTLIFRGLVWALASAPTAVGDAMRPWCS